MYPMQARKYLMGRQAGAYQRPFLCETPGDKRKS